MTNSKVYAKVEKCVEAIRAKTDFVPKVALTLGSGLGDYAKNIDIKAEVSYSEIEGFPVSTVPGHDGKFIFGYVGKTPVVCMKGRVHYYEGYPISDVVLPARVMKMLGAEILFLTNASGGVNYHFSAGDLMLITDHISCFAPNPLIGPNDDRLGLRFPDMSNVYNKKALTKVNAVVNTAIPITIALMLIFIVIINTISSIAFLTISSPGSDITGVPASETSAIFSPFFTFLIISFNFSSVLCL